MVLILKLWLIWLQKYRLYDLVLISEKNGVCIWISPEQENHWNSQIQEHIFRYTKHFSYLVLFSSFIFNESRLTAAEYLNYFFLLSPCILTTLCTQQRPGPILILSCPIFRKWNVKPIMWTTLIVRVGVTQTDKAQDTLNQNHIYH